MQSRITDYHGASRWRWELQDDAGNFLAELDALPPSILDKAFKGEL